jgi:hypothetical protein
MSSPDPHPATPATALIASFTPVPRLKDRSNGWKPEVQRAFIAALAETGSVAAALRRVGRSDCGAYAMRRHPAGAEFRAAWDAALDLGVRRIEDGAMDRALYGVEETVHYHGDLVTTRRRYNEGLVMFILRNRAPDRFAAGGGARGLNAVDQATLKRLKTQWRQEWEQTKALEETAAHRHSGEALIAHVQTMHRAWYCGMTEQVASCPTLPACSQIAQLPTCGHMSRSIQCFQQRLRPIRQRTRSACSLRVRPSES